MRAIEARPPRQVYHLAGATHQGKSFAQTADVLRVNAMGTDVLLRALARHAPTRARHRHQHRLRLRSRARPRWPRTRRSSRPARTRSASWRRSSSPATPAPPRRSRSSSAAPFNHLGPAPDRRLLRAELRAPDRRHRPRRGGSGAEGGQPHGAARSDRRPRRRARLRRRDGARHGGRGLQRLLRRGLRRPRRPRRPDRASPASGSTSRSRRSCCAPSTSRFSSASATRLAPRPAGGRRFRSPTRCGTSWRNGPHGRPPDDHRPVKGRAGGRFVRAPLMIVAEVQRAASIRRPAPRRGRNWPRAAATATPAPSSSRG